VAKLRETKGAAHEIERKGWFGDTPDPHQPEGDLPHSPVYHNPYGDRERERI